MFEAGWTAHEELALLDAIDQHGIAWTYVADALGSKVRLFEKEKNPNQNPNQNKNKQVTKAL